MGFNWAFKGLKQRFRNLYVPHMMHFFYLYRLTTLLSYQIWT